MDTKETRFKIMKTSETDSNPDPVFVDLRMFNLSYLFIETFQLLMELSYKFFFLFIKII